MKLMGVVFHGMLPDGDLRVERVAGVVQFNLALFYVIVYKLTCTSVDLE